MTTFAAEFIEPGLLATFPGRKDIYDRLPVAAQLTINDPLTLDPTDPIGVTGAAGAPPFVPPTEQEFNGQAEQRTGGPGQEFFEFMHVIPRDYRLGNVLATTTIPVEVFNGYRRTLRDWDSFVSNAGVGVTLLGTPSLPFTLAPLGSYDALNLEIGTTGPPVVDSTIDFGFDVPVTLLLPIVFRRVVLFGLVPPELPYVERLRFVTEIHRSKDQTEKRQSPRGRPRQFLRFEFGLEEGRERTTIDNLLFDQQGKTFGIPVYHDAASTSVALTAGAATLPVDTTDFGDFRTDGFLVVYQDGDTFDVVQMTAINPTSFDVNPPLTNSYKAGTLVAPLRLAKSPARVAVRRHRRGLSFHAIEFRVIDNESALVPSGAAFNTYNSKVLLDDPNFLRGVMTEQLSRPQIVFDNTSGQVFQDELTDRSRHLSRKTFWAAGRQAIWELRQLMHLLRGRQISFYLPTFADDFEIVNNLIGASNQLDVVNTGYGQTVDSRSPRNVIKVTFNNGDPPLLREITGAVEVSAVLETLTLDANWPSGVPFGEVSRIELVEFVRLDQDDISIEYQLGGARAARVTSPITTVLE